MTRPHFDFIPTPLSGLTVIQRRTSEDGRGFFSRFYCADEFRAAGLKAPIVQINHSFTRKKGAVRGLHFQNPPHTEAKIVSCLSGEIFDVAVDLRKGSPTFLCGHGETLSSCNHKSLLIPEGFAHGFQTLTEDCELIYLHTASYAPDAEGGLNIHDPRLAIKWPLDITELSDRDRSHPVVGDGFEGIRP
ncbi:MAG: dTDP-4-dehydrorhamnose 3,5-epimerase [Planctomycetota bacterium]